MSLQKRLYLSLPLTPVFWLLYMWIFNLSGHREYSIVVALGYSFLMSFVSAYCVVLFCCQWRQENSSRN